MNKIVIGLAALLIVVAGIGYGVKTSQPGDLLHGLKTYFSGKVTYVADINEKIALLEEELAEIDRMVDAGTLTPEAAVEARTRIIARIDSITQSADAAGKLQLTEAEKASLNTSLTRLSTALITYRGSLTTLDEVAGAKDAATGRSQLNPRGSDSASKRIAEHIRDLISTVEEIDEDVSVGDTLEEELADIEADEDVVPGSDEQVVSEYPEDIDVEETEVIEDNGTPTAEVTGDGNNDTTTTEEEL